MNKLQRLRRSQRSQLSRLVNEAMALLSEDEPDREALQVKLQLLRDINASLEDINTKIIDEMSDADVPDDEMDSEFESINHYKERFAMASVKIERLLCHSRSARGSSVISNDSSDSPERNRKRYRLPKIELKKFNGDLKEWLPFWSQFQKLHEDTELHDGDKFHYLVQAMVQGSRAQDVVESYPQTAENYPKVVCALKERFGRDELLIEVYVRELLKLVIQNVNTTKDFVYFSKLYDQMESHLRSLETLGVTSEKYDAMLFPLIESCLPVVLLRAWQRSSYSKVGGLDYDTSKTKLNLLMDFLKGEVEGEQRIVLATEGFGLNSLSKLHDKRCKLPKDEKAPYPHTAAGLINRETIYKQIKCVFCEKGHDSKECIRAQNMSLNAKKEALRKSKYCFMCFKPNHKSSDCRAFVRCIVCNNRHHVLMCPDVQRKTLNKSEAPQAENETLVACSSHVQRPEIALQTVVVILKNGDIEKPVRALFDSGSQRSYVLKSTAREMGLQSTGKDIITHVLFGGSRTEEVHDKYQITLKKFGGNYQCNLEVLDQEQICGEIPSVSPGRWMSELKGKGIWIEDIKHGEEPIELLFGADMYGKLHTGKMHQLNCGLTVVQTYFGWTVIGTFPRSSNRMDTNQLVVDMFVSSMSISDLWNLESIGITDAYEVKTKEEELTLVQEHFLKTLKQENDGAYKVCLSWISSEVRPPNNLEVAKKRLHSTTQRIEGLGRRQDYQHVFDEWLKEGIIEVVDEKQLKTVNCHYLPHRPIFKSDSLTTKVRPVFDASCKPSGQPSLNDCLYKGPNLISLIPSVLMRFREKTIGVVADIRKAFCMIKMREDDRDYLRFLWWKSSLDDEIIVYRHTRVVFGVNCSPYLLGAVLAHHLSKYTDLDGEVAEKLQESFYVDNCVASVSTKEDLANFIDTSTRIMKEAKMDLRMWQDSQHVDEKSEDREISVLGMKWDRYTDTLRCDVERITPIPNVVTKRLILSTVQKIFDPLGILAPATLLPKLMIQESWAQKLGWDDSVPEVSALKFTKWINEIQVLSDIQIPRLCTDGDEERRGWSLHTFSDASCYAYATIVFLRCAGTNSITLHLLQAKARLAPLKKMTIPRLELMGCYIASCLVKTISETLGLQSVPKYFWTDSTTVLAWITKNENWKVFVANRVRQILQTTKPEDWRYIPSEINPADLVSRGCNPKQLLLSRWWEGPSWLKLSSEQWTRHNYEEDKTTYLVESKPSCEANLTVVENRGLWYMRSSSYSKTVVTMGWILRFLNKTRHRQVSFDKKLTFEEIADAERTLVKLIQSESCLSERKPNLKVFRDKSGILRLETKLLMREDNEYFKTPILLPSKHPLVEALIREEHLKNSHAGTQFLIASLRERFWILRARKSINAVVRRCVTCRRFDAKRIETPTAPLPEDRVRDAQVFEIVGVDLAGPFYLREKKKAWMVLYTCAVYRAIHLELVTSLDTESFLQSFRRFVARRGRPRLVYSDNATNFQGSARLFKSIDWNLIQRKFAVEPVKWKFNPPASPWWGGWWERLIRSVKSLLLRVLGKSSLNYEELVTLLCDIEAVINGRPLTFVTENETDLIPLTPAMFLRDIPEAGIPEVDVLEEQKFQKRYAYRQTLLREIRQRFRKEYLGDLLHRTKERKYTKLKVGDIVFVESDIKKRADWPIAKVVELFPGKDGCVRVVRLRTKNGDLLRPLKRLFPTEVSSFWSESDPVSKDFQESLKTRSGRGVKHVDRFVCS